MSRGGSDYTPGRHRVVESFAVGLPGSGSIFLGGGSNFFGDTLDDVHVFTGSVIISGSLTVAGGVSPGPHASTHIAGSGDEIDGDKLDIDYLPTNYIPDTSPTIVTTTAHLTAHLAGIDAALAAAAGAVGGDLSGTLPNPTVVGLQTTPISTTAPTDSQVLSYNNISGEWEPTTLVDSTIYGTHYRSMETGSLFSTTADVFQNASRYGIDNVPAGKYKIQWLYVWSHNSANSDIEVRVRLNNSLDLLFPYHRQQPAVAGGPGGGPGAPTGNDQRNVLVGFATASLSSGSHFVDIDLRSTQAGKESVIFMSKVEYWRVS